MNNEGVGKISRRDAIKGLFGVTASTSAAALGVPLLLKEGQDFFNEKNLIKREKYLVDLIMNKFGIEVDLGNDRGENWTVGPYSLKKEESLSVKCLLLEEIINELYFYPKDFLKKYIKEINVVKNMGHVLLGFGAVFLGAVYKYDDSVMLRKPPFSWSTEVDILSNISNYYKFLRAGNFRKTIHHEFAHAYTISNSHGIIIEIDNLSYQALLNEEMSSMESEGLNMVVPNNESLNISEYAGVNSIEDIAETVGFMFSDPKKVKNICRRNPVIHAKVRVLRKYLFKISNGRFNPQYWKDLEDGKVDKNYFYP